MRPTTKRWMFEGELRSRLEIMAMIPAIKAWETIKLRIEAGDTNRREVLSYNTSAARSAGGKRGYAKTNSHLFPQRGA